MRDSLEDVVVGTEPEHLEDLCAGDDTVSGVAGQCTLEVMGHGLVGIRRGEEQHEPVIAVDDRECAGVRANALIQLTGMLYGFVAPPVPAFLDVGVLTATEKNCHDNPASPLSGAWGVKELHYYSIIN